MNKELSFSTSVNINASKEAVWDALINPEKIKEYLFGTEAVSDWQPGSDIVFKGEWDGQTYEDKGVIQEVEENKLFIYSYWSGFSGMEDLPENYSLVRFDIIEQEDSLELVVSQIGFASEEGLKHATQSWEMVLNNLKELVENE